MLIILRIICIGAKINETYSIHKMLILKNKNFFEEIAFTYDSFMQGLLQTTNPLFKRIIDSLTFIRDKFKLDENSLDIYIKGLRSLYNILLKELELFEKH